MVSSYRRIEQFCDDPEKHGCGRRKAPLLLHTHGGTDAPECTTCTTTTPERANMYAPLEDRRRDRKENMYAPEQERGIMSDRESPLFRGGRSETQDEDLTTSKMENAMRQTIDVLDGLGNNITRLEDRLSVVSNTYPLTDENDVRKSPEEKPTGDSQLLVEVYHLTEALKHQSDRIRSLCNKLDI